MNKYIYDNCELIKVSDFDKISFTSTEDSIIIQVLKLSNEKNKFDKLIFNEIDLDLEYDLSAYLKDENSCKSIKEITEELEECFVNFMDSSDERIFKIFNKIEKIATPIDPLSFANLLI
ncbi:hypothetical protein [Clostridium perfringens]|uniref:hypothetical protein n=1 Tax=Clostridium perfringens TaxID=1502 RepID=UPI001DE876D9|nr:MULTISPECIES: hypothetical protein [Clostridia]MBW4861905.1 hypothetical protein [Paeniclostridium sp.]